MMNIDTFANPLILNPNANIYINNELKKLSSLNNNELYNMYKDINIICLKNNHINISILNNIEISTDNWNEIKKNITIIKSRVNILNGNMYKLIGVVNKKYLNEINQKLTYFDDNLVLNMTQFRKNNVKNYLKQFEHIVSFFDIYEIFYLNQYYSDNFNNTKYRNNIIMMINSMKESLHWTIPNNCKLNISMQFINRKFDLRFMNRITNQEAQDVITKIISKNEEDNNYLSHLYKKANYIDAASAIDKNGFKIYKISNSQNEKNISNETINILLDTIQTKEKYYLIMNLLVSKNLCHLIINNKSVLEFINIKNNDISFFSKNYYLLKYLMGYTWLTLYIEESIKKSFINKNDRFVFDIDTASLLPHFVWDIKNPSSNPYLPLLINKTLINCDENIMGVIPGYLQSENNRYLMGVSNKDTFIKRLNIFINGNLNNHNILDGINWNNIAITGSVIAACLPKFNPLMLNFLSVDKINTDDNEYFLKFIEKYYTNADIDVMCNITDKMKYIDKIYEIYDKMELNIKKYIAKDDKVIDIIKLKAVKNISIIINEAFIINNIVKKSNMSLQEIKNNVNNPIIKNILYENYINWQILQNEKYFNTEYFNNKKYNDYFDFVSIDKINILVSSNKPNNIDKKNTNDNDEDIELFCEHDNITENNENIWITVNLKYHLESKYLARKFEFFQIKYDDFFSTVSLFHFPIVRAYYDGDTVLMLPSCISACQTLVNLDYKYFAGSKDPIEIINKYRTRGFSVLLNAKEIIRLVEYSNMIPKWRELYHNFTLKSDKVKLIFGYKKYDDMIFGKITGEKNKNNSDYYINHYCSYDKFNHINEIETKLCNIKANNNDKYPSIINKEGYLSVLKKWVIDANYNSYKI
jgi:hypothetical protein